VISFTKVKYKCTFQISKGNSKPFDLLTSFANAFTFVLFNHLSMSYLQRDIKEL